MKRNHSTTSAMEVAKWFIKQDYDSPRDTLKGNMKIQKLLYFSQLIHIAKHGHPLFDEPIYAYENGSVIEDVRIAYRENLYGLLAEAKSRLSFDFPEDVLETLEITKNIFGDLDANELSELNHLFDNWKTSYDRSKVASGFRMKELSMITVDSITETDYERINEMLEAYQTAKEHYQECVIINNKRFYFDPKCVPISEEIIAQLQNFEGEDTSYSIYFDENAGLVIY